MNGHRQWSTKNPSLFRNLPEDLIPQILVRLPVRSLLRFKSVCKSWRSLISDPKFGKSHFDLAASPTHRCLTLAHGSEIESIDVDASLQNSESSVVNLKFPPSLSRPYNPVEFFGSCRGFVLVAYDQDDVVVWNPSTGDRRRIAGIGDSFYSAHGFGYEKKLPFELFHLGGDEVNKSQFV
ncbi:putative F-box/kelch-repeat protein At3g17570 isoform X2 [Lotus japonicus]|uniref:putative F-box/kelch-repeat protein At3g17570 isoform X2 n=1 Tax=Lotus japonicus TaxID=34305 RepID=UPI00258A6A52|nr:putative F-box/kelch-repeat protein At3g17570 isoform X2 [Lotus japonicus]